jgi:hypothetical protein
MSSFLAVSVATERFQQTSGSASANLESTLRQALAQTAATAGQRFQE